MSKPKWEDATDEERALWDQVYVAVARAESCTDGGAPASWADKALQARRERFGRAGSTTTGVTRYERVA